ncbi:MAG TPA: pyridoxal 5'-phosphate synthase glutaminase subunit PdxT [Candidatus Thermoplasmatota archaeon]|nr:pyridoxal 5'-phosphate synthase glutaminase subunit PdxT [Candidatus Thermoplasmatota archaeon]
MPKPARPSPIRVGVLAVQGAVSEHLDAIRRAAAKRGWDVEAVPVRTPKDLAGVHGLVLPGGESTTISRLLRSGNLQDSVVQRATSGDLALFGTCAGLILLSKSARHDVESKDIQLLGLLDAEVDRNAFGRQKDSFESALDVAGIGKMPAVFIRAPVLTKAWAPTEVLARNDRGIVAVRKGRILGTAFHPELTDDTRLHEWFITFAAQAAAARSPSP